MSWVDEWCFASLRDMVYIKAAHNAFMIPQILLTLGAVKSLPNTPCAFGSFSQSNAEAHGSHGFKPNLFRYNVDN